MRLDPFNCAAAAATEAVSTELWGGVGKKISVSKLSSGCSAQAWEEAFAVDTASDDEMMGISESSNLTSTFLIL